MTDEQTARQRLIDKLADQMDRDNAEAFVDEVIAEAWNARGAADITAIDDVAHTNTKAVADAITALDRPRRGGGLTTG